MPKKLRQLKNSRRGTGPGAQPRRHIVGIGELLGRQPLLRSLEATQAVRQDWLEWLGRRLPEALAPHCCQVLFRNGELTVFADSAAWSARLRYALAELETAIRQRDERVTAIRIRTLAAG
jgi:predicted nucleic acid-binding Zn ribbon protein